MKTADLVLAGAGQLITCTGSAADSLGIIRDGWLAAAGGEIIAVGSAAEVKQSVDCSRARLLDCAGKVVLPGFVDCHTHLVFGGSRAEEYAARMTEEDPEILRQMGIETGIMVSVRMTRAADEASLYRQSADRALRMLRAGTTTVESKSGYGLTLADELKQLRVNRLLQERLPLDVVSTFLGAHGWPPEIGRARYIDALVREMIPEVAARGLAVACDAWCDEGHFTSADAAVILQAALDAGFKAKLHTDAYSYIGGSDLAADLRLLSADHLNYTPRPALRKLARAGVVGVLLPALDFAVRHPRPFRPRPMLDEGMTVALATNLCPGCWTESLQFVMALACRLYQMKPAEAVRAATLGGARALGLEQSRGSLEVGKLADLQIWNAPAFEHVVYRLGGNVVETVIKRGEIVVGRDHAQGGCP